jgi:hypothetical protein
MPRYQRLSRSDQHELAREMARLYTEGHWSIRELSAYYRRSYGTVHRYLSEIAEVRMRPQGRYSRE